jgi:hypothetical protein
MKYPADSHEPFRGRAAASALAFLFLLRRRARADLDDAHPRYVIETKKTGYLADLAMRLSCDVSEESQVISSLRRAAGHLNKRTRLRSAAAIVRHRGLIYEDEVHERANRLLLAAAGTKPPEAPSSEQFALFHEVQVLRTLPPSQAYERLKSFSPELRQLEERVIVASQRQGGVHKDIREESDRRFWAEFGGDLSSLLGERASSDVPILRTRTAYVAGLRHLKDVYASG